MMADSVSSGPRPVHVLTGFLGSGKTTLLRHWLGDPAARDTAVIVNEFGLIGLDHLLLREVTSDIVLLRSGCLCCTVRDDLVSTLEELAELATTGAIPAFARVAVETTGLADPVPVMQLLMGEVRLAGRYRLGRTIATVDAVNGAATLARHQEALQQAMFADALVVTKGDLARPSDLDLLDAALRRLNAEAERFASAPGQMPGTMVLLGDAPSSRRVVAGHRHAHGTENTHGIDSFTVSFDRPIERAAFLDWLTLLLFSRGSQILRVKGILHFAGDDLPTIIQGVQHIVYPPQPFVAAPEGDGSSALVFITRGVTQSAVERSLQGVLG